MNMANDGRSVSIGGFSGPYFEPCKRHYTCHWCEEMWSFVGTKKEPCPGCQRQLECKGDVK